MLRSGLRMKASAPLSWSDRRAGSHRLLGVEDGRQHLVLDLDLAAPFLGGGLGLGHHGGHPLPDEAHHVVEHVGVVGIDAEVVVDGGGVELPRHVLPGEDRMHARHGERGVLVDRDDAGVGVRRAEHLQVQHPLHRGVEGVAGLAGDDRLGPAGAPTPHADGRAGLVVLDGAHAVDRVLDGVVAGAAAEVALEMPRQVLASSAVKVGGRHDHAGGAEAALEPLRVEERLLHRVQLAVPGQSLDGRDLAALGAEGGDEAAVDRHAVEPDGAGAAVAGVAPLLDAEPAQVAQEGAQALAGRRLLGERLAVDVKSDCSS